MDTPNDENEDNEEYENVCEAEGENDKYEVEEQVYVVRKLFLSPKPTEENQRHKLFLTRCAILGKTFDLIIDNGSLENIIGREVIEKLHLPVEKHPTP